MKRKLFVLICIAITCIVCAFGLTACDEDKLNDGDDGKGTIQTPSDTDDTVEIKEIYLDKSSLSLYIGDSRTLIVTVLPINATQKVSWISTDPSVATIENGKITCLDEGETTVIASSPNGISASCTVTVKNTLSGCVFEEYGDGYAVIAYTGPATSLTIPSMHEGKKVIAIGSGKFDGDYPVADGFTNCRNLVKIEIPDTVETINYGAFKNCESLQELIIPDSVTTVNAEAFQGDYILKKVTCPAEALSYLPKSNLETVIITSGNEICDYALSGFSELTSVTLPNTVTTIGRSAFNGCSSLTSITIPDSVTTIGGGAFNGCSSLTSITIPDSVTSIGEGAFSGCRSKKVYISNIEAWFGIQFDNESANPLRWGSNLYLNNESVTEIKIPNDVTKIGNYLFCNYSGLTSVTIPDSVISIGQGAFSGCSGLTSITIPDAVTSIGDHAFAFCSGLTSVTIPDGVTSIGVGAFNGCNGLTSVTIGTSVTTIGDSAFHSCSSLTSINIPNSVTTIGAWAFRYCSELTEINYGGTEEQWNSIRQGGFWDYSTGNYVIHCIGGDIEKY